MWTTGDGGRKIFRLMAASGVQGSGSGSLFLREGLGFRVSWVHVHGTVFN